MPYTSSFLLAAQAEPSALRNKLCAVQWLPAEAGKGGAMKAPHLSTLRIVEAEELHLAVLRQGARQVPDVSVHPDSTMSSVKAHASQVAVSPVSAKGSETTWQSGFTDPDACMRRQRQQRSCAFTSGFHF